MKRYEQVLIANANIHDDIEREMLGWRDPVKKKKVIGMLDKALTPDFENMVENVESEFILIQEAVLLNARNYIAQMIFLGNMTAKKLYGE